MISLEVMMKKHILSTMVALALLANTTWAQLDLGGAISGAINGATGNTQAGAGAATVLLRERMCQAATWAQMSARA